MIGIKRPHVLPIAVDLGFDSIKLLQLAVHNGALSVVAATREAMPEETRQQPATRVPVAMDMLRRMIRGGGFVGRSIVAALPRDVVQVKNLRLPQMPASELEAAVNFEARNIFPFDTDQAQVGHLHAGEVRQGADARQEVIVLAARSSDVNDFIESLHRCGVVIESLDFEPCAIYRGTERFIRRKEDEHEVHVLVEVGARRSQVVIGKGRDISFFKPIDIGGQHLQDAVVRKLGITPDEARALRRRLIDGTGENDPSTRRDPVRQAVHDATRLIAEDLAREISLCLRYYSVTFRGHRPSRVRLTGGEACDPRLQSILTANLPLPVETMRPLHNVDTSKMKPHDRRGQLSEWAVAFGLGLKLTTEYFGDRDAKRRGASTREQFRSGAEVIDIASAIQAPLHAPLQVPIPSPGVPGAPVEPSAVARKKEVLRA